MAYSSTGTERIVAGKGTHDGKSRKLADDIASKQETEQEMRSGCKISTLSPATPPVIHFLLLKVPYTTFPNGTFSWGPRVQRSKCLGIFGIQTTKGLLTQSANHLKNL